MANQYNGQWRTGQRYAQDEGRYEQDFDRDDYWRGRSSWRDDPDWDRGYGQYGRSGQDYSRSGRDGSDWDRDYGQYRRGSSDWDRDYGQYGGRGMDWGRGYGRSERGDFNMTGSWGGHTRYNQGSRFDRDRDYGQHKGSSEWSRDYGQYEYGGPEWDRSFERSGGGTGDEEAGRDVDWYGRGSSDWNREYGRYGRGSSETNRGYERYGRNRSEWDRDYGESRGGYDYDWEGGYSQQYERYGGIPRLHRSATPEYQNSEFWSTPGPYYGQGPRGYQRSNERIQEDICERMTRHGQLNPENVEIEVNNGQVTLKGTVESRQAKRMAEDVAESVIGVSQVLNQLQIRQGRQQFDEESSTSEGTSA